MTGSVPVVPRSAWTRPLLVLMALLAALGTLALVAQAAFAGTPLNGGPAPLTGSAFQGADGNQKAPLPGDPDFVAMPARTDWQTYASSPRLSTLPDGSGLNDSWFFHGKEQEPDKWTFQSDEVSPGKADVLGAWSATDPVSANVFLYLSFFRAAAGGTTFYNFELNQLATTWTNSQGTLIPCRKNGDIIVSFELQGGPGDVGVRAWKWQSTSPGPAACPEGKIGTWTPTGALSTDPLGNTIAQGAMNTGPIANYLDFDLDGDGDASTNPSPASFNTADTFGEAALNLTKVLASLNNGDSCFNFGQMQLHTRSSEPFTSDLKDFIAPKPIIARSCTIEGRKYHDLDADGTEDAGEPGLAGFRIYADTNDSGSFDAGEPSTFTADGTQPGKPLGSWVLGGLPAGNYKIREDLTNASGNPRATEGWTCSDPSPCRFDVALANGGAVGGLKFGNYKKALVRVEKQTVPDGAAGSFGFTSTLPGKASFNLSDGGVEETLVKPGAYTAAETPHPDFDLTGIACTSGGQATSPTAVRFDAKSGQTITCTYTNTRKTGRLTVRKLLDPATDPGRFDLRIGNDLVVDDGGHLAQGTRTLATGTGYTVSEAGGTGTSLSDYDSSVVCKDGNVTVASGAGASLAGVPVIDGHDVVCTFTNKRHGSVIVVKTEGHAAPAAGRVWRFTLSGGPDGIDEQRQTDGGSGPDQVAFDGLKAGTYTLCEVGLPAGWHSSLEQEPGAVVDPQTGDVCIAITVANGETETIAVDNVRPDIELDKTVQRLPGGSFAKQVAAHVGDTVRYRFRVTNPGVGALTVVLQELAPDRCDGAPTAPAGDADGDGKLDPGEQWDFFCTHVITAGDPDPLPNTAKATGTDEYGNSDADESSAAVDVLHPDIEIDKRVDRASAHVGDTLAYSFVVTNEGDTPLGVVFSDPRCDAGTLTGPSGDGDGDGKLDVDETWTYACSHVVLEQDPSPLPNTATVTGTDELGGTDEDEDSTSVLVIRPAALVVKEGNQFAYPGDTVTFTFAVTNTGNAPLTDVVVTDDRCAPVIRASGDGQLDPGETWMFTCSKQIPAGHRIGDENPIRNVATATGKDPLGKTVESTDDHVVRVLHPAVDIEKTGPATALLGTPLAYTLTVTNPGDVPFASQQVVVSDPRCEAPPAGPGTGADATPGQLDPGDRWTYTCTAQTAGQPAGTFVNRATVTARDFNGREVSDSDDFPTMLETQQVLAEFVDGSARLRGPSGCVHRRFRATVRGSKIAQVTFYRDGKRIKRIVAKAGQRRFSVMVEPARAQGVHRITAKIRFRSASQTRTRTLRLSYQRCRKQIVRPQFTG